MSVVGIDCRFGSAYAGLGTYTRGVVQALVARKDPWDYRLFVYSEHEDWLEPLRRAPRVRLIEAPFRHYSMAEQVEFPNVIQSAECDALLSPHFNVPLFCPVPFVCTVHDLILHSFPNEAGFLKRVAYRFVLNRAIRGARAIGVVSNATKDDVFRHYGAEAATKAVVCYPGVGTEFRPAPASHQEDVKQKYRLMQPYLLYVGNCKQHKNVAMLLSAFERAGLPGVELVLVSGGRESGSLRRTDGVRFLSSVIPEDMPALYSGSLGIVTATLAEGFCLPLVEAMACACPVLATNVGPIPEVCGDHALLVEPTTSALTQGLRHLVTDKRWRDAARLEAARIWSQRYSWTVTAETIAGMVRGILE